MPTYEFICDTCGQSFSEQLPFNTPAIPPCPSCKDNLKVRKIIRAPMVHFKGSGFYKTDSIKPAPKPAPNKPEAKPAEPAGAPAPAPVTKKVETSPKE